MNAEVRFWDKYYFLMIELEDKLNYILSKKTNYPNFQKRILKKYSIESAAYKILDHLWCWEIKFPNDHGVHEKLIAIDTKIDLELLQDYLFELSYEGWIYQPNIDYFKLKF